MDDAKVGGVSGSYGIMNPESRLACLIHEEIIDRHRRMGTRVDFLATFNVLYRRAALEQVGGLDERYLKAQDAELSFRVMDAGYDLHFEFASRVKHYHEAHWLKYLKTQQRQGYWRVYLHMSYPRHSAGDSYSSALDHMQPPLAMISLVSLVLLLVPVVRWFVLAAVYPAADRAGSADAGASCRRLEANALCRLRDNGLPARLLAGCGHDAGTARLLDRPRSQAAACTARSGGRT